MKIRNLINNELVPALSGRTLQTIEPATGQPWGELPDSDNGDVEAAIEAAEAAFPAWSETPAEERAAVLHRLADRVDAHREELARIESRDTGKPLSLARQVDIPRVASNLRFFAGAATQFASESHAGASGTLNYTLRQPLGPVAGISPWNLPLYLFSWKIAPALAAGNTVVGKPSEVTPATAGVFSELAIEAGMPPGVLNIVHGTGPGAGASLVTDQRIKAVSFTGGTRTGAWIAEALAPSFKKISLELGGKNPTLVFDDSRFEDALEGAVRAGFSNQGQICLCGSRLLVQRSIYDRFRDAYVDRVGRLKVGDPEKADTDQGAVVSQQHRDKILRHLEIARDEGGRVLCGGGPVQIEGRCANGYFLQPTVIEGLAADARTNQEEIFGPVVTLIPFEDEAEAIAIANGTPYGLAASIWSEDVHRCHRVARRLESGIVWVNCWMQRDLRTPFGGIKASGLGREGGFEAMRFFTEAKNVCLQVQ